MAATTAGNASRSERRLGSVEQFWFMAENSGQPQSASSGIGRVRLRQRAATPRSAAWRRCACRTPIDAAATIASSTNPAAPRNPAWKPIGSAWLMGDEREFGGARACIHHPSAGACATAIAAGHALAAGVRPRPDSRLVTNLSHWTEFAVTLAGVAAVSCRTGVRRAVGGPRADPPRCRLPGRAGETVVVFIGAVVQCAFLLIPDLGRVGVDVGLLVAGTLGRSV